MQERNSTAGLRIGNPVQLTLVKGKDGLIECRRLIDHDLVGGPGNDPKPGIGKMGVEVPGMVRTVDNVTFTP